MKGVNSVFGTRLKNARKDAGYSQEELAEELQVDVTQIYRWETSKTEPSVSVAASIAKALSVSLDYLLGLSEDSTPASMAGGSLNAREKLVLRHWREGNPMKAIKVIAGED